MEMKSGATCVRWDEIRFIRTMWCYKIYDVMIKHVKRIKHI